MHDRDRRLAVRLRQQAQAAALEGDVATATMYADAAQVAGMRRCERLENFDDVLNGGGGWYLCPSSGGRSKLLREMAQL